MNPTIYTSFKLWKIRVNKPLVKKTAFKNTFSLRLSVCIFGAAPGFFDDFFFPLAEWMRFYAQIVEFKDMIIITTVIHHIIVLYEGIHLTAYKLRHICQGPGINCYRSLTCAVKLLTLRLH